MNINIDANEPIHRIHFEDEADAELVAKQILWRLGKLPMKKRHG